MYVCILLHTPDLSIAKDRMLHWNYEEENDRS